MLDVAQAAQRISGSNLSLRIPTREAGDELDYLILTFNRMIERLESSFQQMKQFSADVSHELRTPITAIRGQLEVALFTAQTTEQYREAMFNALQDIDRLSQIVRALLLLSQAESGQLVLQKSRLDLGEVAEDLVEQFQIPAEAAGVRLTADLRAGVFRGGRPRADRAHDHQPALQRHQVHARRRRGAAVALGPRRNTWRSWWRIPAAASPPSTCRTSSTASTAFPDRAARPVRSRAGTGFELRGVDRESAPRQDRGGQHSGQGDALHHPAARRRSGIGHPGDECRRRPTPES